MPSTYTAADFLRQFGEIYKTLDLRVACIRYEKHWLLVAASARYRIVSSEAAIAEFEGLGNQFGRVDSSALRIVQQCLRIADAKAFFDLLKQGELAVNDLRIALSNSHDVLSQGGHLRLDYQNPNRWPSIEIRREIDKNDTVAQALLSNPLVLRDAELAGYEYPYVAVKTLLDIDYSQSSPGGLLWIECDMPMRLLDPVVARHGSELELILRAQSDNAIRDAACTVRQIGRNAQVISQSVVQLDRSQGTEEGVVSWSGQFRMRIQDEEDLLTLEALSGEVGRLYSIRIRPFDLLPLRHANPLLAALEVFCSADQIRLLVEEPQKAEVGVLGKKNQGRVFEVSVHWLLSALGFRAIWLHAYETVKDGKVELGTVDCLAYSEEENMVVLVNCSLAAPDPSELHRQENLTAWFRKRFFPDSRIAIYAALFTAAHRPETDQGQRYGSAVRVFFKEDLVELLDAARAGRKLEYQTFVHPAGDWDGVGGSRF